MFDRHQLTMTSSSTSSSLAVDAMRSKVETLLEPEINHQSRWRIHVTSEHILLTQFGGPEVGGGTMKAENTSGGSEGVDDLVQGKISSASQVNCILRSSLESWRNASLDRLHVFLFIRTSEKILRLGCP